MKNWKFNFILSIFFLLVFILIFRLAQFQVINNDYWKALAHAQHKFFLQTESDRGEIFLTDRFGNLHPLAINRSWEYVYISPREMHNKKVDLEEVSATLAEILQLDIEEIIKKTKRSYSSYEVLKRRLSPEEVSLLKGIQFYGVHIKEDDIRYYPQDNLASQVVGFLGGKGFGQYGIEEYYNETLKGSLVLQKGRRLPGGHLINRTFGSLEPGEKIILTIDYNIQFMAETLLEEARENLNIEGGTILVGDPHTGKIIAMATYPNFNPNEFFNEKDFSIFKNPAIQSLFEPGSIFKSITMAIALEEGNITPETIYNDIGFVQIGRHRIRNFAQRTWGTVCMTEALRRSINTAAVFVGELIGNEIFLDYMEKFGFFSPTEINLQGEVYSRNFSFKEGHEINFANATFGQGIEVTPIQLFRAFSALANGGKLVNPHIVKKEEEVLIGKRILSQKTSSEITSMMVSVIDDGWTSAARVPGYLVAGKTGTAQVAWSALGIPKRGYSDNTIQSFVGYAPAFNPSFLILVKLNNPQTKTAEYSAAPIFGDLTRFIIDYYQIPPERKQ